MSDGQSKKELFNAQFKDEQSRLFNQEIGQKATIHREDVTGDAVGSANVALRELGDWIGHSGMIPKGLNYKGSAAVHIWQSEILGQIFFVSQTGPLQDVQEDVAAKAFEDLRGNMQEQYGHKRQKRRSGF